MKMKKIISLAIFNMLFSGCTFLKAGDFVAQSHFIHPGSTVSILGDVKAEIHDWGFIFPPQFDYAEAMTLYETALNQKPGADMLIDYTIDITCMQYPTPLLFLPIYTMEVYISGKAADVKTGEKY